MPSSCAPGEETHSCPKFVLKPLHETNTHRAHSLLHGVIRRAVFMRMDAGDTYFAGMLSGAPFGVEDGGGW